MLVAARKKILAPDKLCIYDLPEIIFHLFLFL